MSTSVLARGIARAACSGLAGTGNDMWVADFTAGTLPAGMTFTRASNACFVGPTLQTVGNDLPRYDLPYGLSGPRGLMVEGNRTNLLVNSAALVPQSVTVSATPYTLSFYGTGTISLSGSATGTLPGVGAFPNRATLTFTPTAGTLTLSVTGDVQYAQLSQGSYVSSYIPTTSVSATRAAEFPLIADVSQIGFNPVEGTWFLDTYSSPDPLGIQLGFAIGNGSTHRGHLMAGPGQVNMFFISSQGTANLSAAPIPSGTPLKMAGSYSFSPTSGLKILMAVNGALVGVSQVAGMTSPIAFDSILPGYRRNNSLTGQQWCYAPLTRMAYSPFKADDAALVGMTI